MGDTPKRHHAAVHQLELPFKPFTTEEVSAITGAPSILIDALIGADCLPLQRGDDGLSMGLNWVQTFAVFVGHRYLTEGAPPDRVTGVVRYMSSLNVNWMEQQLEKGNTYPVPREQLFEILREERLPQQMNGMLVPAPKGILGERLCLRKLYAEFNDNIKKVFPW